VADNPDDRSRPYVAAGALFFDYAGRVMLVRPIYKDFWDIPGVTSIRARRPMRRARVR
jgi:hypothetical protein